MADTQPKVDSAVESAVDAPSVDQTQKEAKSVTIDDPKSEEAAPATDAAEDSTDKPAEEEKPKKASPLKKISASLKGLFKCLPGRREAAPKKDEDAAAEGKDVDEDSVKETGVDISKEEESSGIPKPELPAVTEEKKEHEGVASTLTTTITANTPAN